MSGAETVRVLKETSDPADSAALNGEVNPETATAVDGWPKPLSEDAFYGVAGSVVGTIGPRPRPTRPRSSSSS